MTAKKRAARRQPADLIRVIFDVWIRGCKPTNGVGGSAKIYRSPKQIRVYPDQSKKLLILGFSSIGCGDCGGMGSCGAA